VATLFERIRDIAAHNLDVDPDEVTMESKFADDLGADSLDLVELIMAIEEEFSTPETTISISDDDAKNLITVGDAVNWLTEHNVEN